MDKIVRDEVCWTEFEKTGSITDYLKYKSINNAIDNDEEDTIRNDNLCCRDLSYR